MSASMKGKTRSAATRAKIRASHMGKTLSADHRAKISAAHKGKTLTADHRAKISASLKGNTRNKGNTHSEATKAKISASQKGKTISAKQRAKISASLKDLSEATKAKMRGTWKITFFDGTTDTTDNLKAWCEKKGINFCQNHVHYRTLLLSYPE